MANRAGNALALHVVALTTLCFCVWTIRVRAQSSSAASPADRLVASVDALHSPAREVTISLLTPMNFPSIATADGIGGDPNKLFGHVVYAGFRGMDHPIAITRVNYAWVMDWYNPQATQQSQAQVQAPFTIIPFWDMKGDAQQGVIATGERTLCNPSTSFSKCIAIQWPWDFSSSDRQRNLLRAFWHGSLLESKRDKSGLGYSRNRYFDPSTGRFTQEDPIGVAGGLNLYGFGGGDAINFADPFGLSPDTAFADDNARQAVHQCVRESAECAREVSDLASDSTTWTFQTARIRPPSPDATATYRDAEGAPFGGVINIWPPNIPIAAQGLGIPVNTTAVLTHEMGHAIGNMVFWRNYRDREGCNESCATLFENVARTEMNLPLRPR